MCSLPRTLTRTYVAIESARCTRNLNPDVRHASSRRSRYVPSYLKVPLSGIAGSWKPELIFLGSAMRRLLYAPGAAGTAGLAGTTMNPTKLCRIVNRGRGLQRVHHSIHREQLFLLQLPTLGMVHQACTFCITATTTGQTYSQASTRAMISSRLSNRVLWSEASPSPWPLRISGTSSLCILPIGLQSIHSRRSR